MKLDKSNINWYRDLDWKWDRRHVHVPTIMNRVPDLVDKTILDLGCGYGYFTERFTEAKTAIGMDISSDAITEANRRQAVLKEKFGEVNTTYRVGNVFEDSLPNADVITAPYVFNYCTDLSGFLQNLNESLSPGGLVILTLDEPNMPFDGDIEKNARVCGYMGSEEEYVALRKRVGCLKTANGRELGAEVTAKMYLGRMIGEIDDIRYIPFTDFEDAANKCDFTVEKTQPIIDNSDGCLTDVEEKVIAQSSDLQYVTLSKPG